MNYNNTFYKNLIKPKFLPQKIIFKIVWPILYILMFISLIILIFTKTEKSKIPSITIFIIQLLLNILWPIIFFRNKSIQISFIISIILTVTVLLMIKIFFEINPMSAYLNIPYFLWTVFACILMFFIYIKNKS